MQDVLKVVGSMFALIALYLIIVKGPSGAIGVLQSGGNFLVAQTSVLQGNTPPSGTINSNP